MFDETELYSRNDGKTTKLSFPENKGRRYFGLESLSVRASANDKTMIREYMASQAFAAAQTESGISERGPLVYRLAPAKLFVSYNRKESEGPEGNFTRLFKGYYYDYKGYYSLAENIDKIFLESRFEKTKLKGFHLAGADLARASLSPKSFKSEGWSYKYVDGEKVKDDATSAAMDKVMQELMELLKPEVSDETLRREIDIESVVNYMATAYYAGHWDSLLTNANNDFLYYDGAAQKWKLIAWDLDNSYGANYQERLMSKNFYAPALAQPNALFTVLFAPEREAFRLQLKTKIQSLREGFFAEENFSKRLWQRRNAVKTWAESWEEPAEKDYEGILNFVRSRNASVKKSLE